jgi:hypothetical protein
MMGSGMCRHFGQRSRRPPKTCRPQKESPGRAEANELNRRVRKLYLPLGGRLFWLRRAYEPARSATPKTPPGEGHGHQD